ISNGKARVILDISKIEQFQPGEILVTDRTDPDWEPIMKKASAFPLLIPSPTARPIVRGVGEGEMGRGGELLFSPFVSLQVAPLATTEGTSATQWLTLSSCLLVPKNL
ncbi:MAG: hypothetical protein AAFQ23_15435, partial [Cyanobacteria bacterium J06623_1]